MGLLDSARAALVPIFAMLVACDGTGASDALDAAPGATRRCSHCGWIESKEEIRPGASGPDAVVVYEYRVRMADGSRGVFREKASPHWRVGERLIFIGETDAAGVSQR